jgi:hypothetical protein
VCGARRAAASSLCRAAGFASGLDGCGAASGGALLLQLAQLGRDERRLVPHVVNLSHMPQGLQGHRAGPLEWQAFRRGPPRGNAAMIGSGYLGCEMAKGLEVVCEIFSFMIINSS